MSLVMMMITYTLVFRILLPFHPMIKQMIQTNTHSSTFKQLFYNNKSRIFSLSTFVIDTTEPIKLSTHTSQVILFYDPSFFKYKNYFQGFFLPDDFSLDLHTLQHQQTQDLVLKTVYHWIRHNAKPDHPTPLIHGSPFLHTYYKINFF